jgi:hypothetical protein
MSGLLIYFVGRPAKLFCADIVEELLVRVTEVFMSFMTFKRPFEPF